MATRFHARVCVVQLLYAQELESLEFVEKAEDYFDNQGIKNKQREFANSLLKGILSSQSEIDLLIRHFLKDWDLDRLGVLEKAILRLGIYEVIFTQTDNAVVINESLQLVREFYDDEEKTKNLINAILDSISNANKEDLEGFKATQLELLTQKEKEERLKLQALEKELLAKEAIKKDRVRRRQDSKPREFKDREFRTRDSKTREFKDRDFKTRDSKTREFKDRDFKTRDSRKESFKEGGFKNKKDFRENDNSKFKKDEDKRPRRDFSQSKEGSKDRQDKRSFGDFKDRSFKKEGNFKDKRDFKDKDSFKDKKDFGDRGFKKDNTEGFKRSFKKEGDFRGKKDFGDRKDLKDKRDFKDKDYKKDTSQSRVFRAKGFSSLSTKTTTFKESNLKETKDHAKSTNFKKGSTKTDENKTVRSPRPTNQGRKPSPSKKP
ncbi:transcription antitermination factor NusB [Helicobacter sp. 13S00401-1]|uniref:transcription antitermination factor NusB n=1 Tax=Helicobacter sp. 13S00401-1 TaxID=1905758 RepID=UPI000BA63508|nr:transcription antitermination factor NusB [Helicobacter sp. 13S00401-1]PAF50058.1 transcription antitermination factor NusB [Helicobacter sp. 13S00401-1]